MLIQGDPDKNFWEYNKELKFVTPFKKLYDDYGDKESSKIMWAIYLTEDPRSRFYRIPREHSVCKDRGHPKCPRDRGQTF